MTGRTFVAYIPVRRFSFYYFLSSPSVLLSSLTCNRFYPLSDLLDKPWSQVSSLLPPAVLAFIFVAHGVRRFHFSALYVCW